MLQRCFRCHKCGPRHNFDFQNHAADTLSNFDKLLCAKIQSFKHLSRTQFRLPKRCTGHAFDFSDTLSSFNKLFGPKSRVSKTCLGQSPEFQKPVAHTVSASNKLYRTCFRVAQNLMRTHTHTHTHTRTHFRRSNTRADYD